MSQNQAPSNGKYKRAPPNNLGWQKCLLLKRINELIIQRSSEMEMMIKKARPTEKYQSYYQNKKNRGGNTSVIYSVIMCVFFSEKQPTMEEQKSRRNLPLNNYYNLFSFDPSTPQMEFGSNAQIPNLLSSKEKETPTNIAIIFSVHFEKRSCDIYSINFIFEKVK